MLLLSVLATAFYQRNHYHNEQSLQQHCVYQLVAVNCAMGTICMCIAEKIYMMTCLFWSESVLSFQMYTSSRCAHIEILILTLISGCGHLMMSCTVWFIRTCLNIHLAEIKKMYRDGRWSYWLTKFTYKQMEVLLADKVHKQESQHVAIRFTHATIPT